MNQSENQDLRDRMLGQFYQSKTIGDPKRSDAGELSLKGTLPGSRYFQSPRNNSKSNNSRIMDDVEQFKVNKLQNIAVARPPKDFSPQMKPKIDRSKIRRFATSKDESLDVHSRMNSSVEDSRTMGKKVYEGRNHRRRSKSEFRDKSDDFGHEETGQFEMERSCNSPLAKGNQLGKLSKHRYNLRPLQLNHLKSLPLEK